MTTVAIPAWLPREPELKVQDDAGAVLTDVRAAATAVSDVAEWAVDHGAPAGFTGDAADAASHAVTRFARDADAVGAALGRGALAIDAFLSRMRRRRAEHADLMDARQRLNDDRESLLGRIEAATEDQAAGLRAEAAELRRRFDAYRDDLHAWRDAVDADEQACVRALAAVDTLAEGLTAAADPTRTDTAALAAELRRLGTDTAAVNAWWNGLSQADRNALMISDPGLVGNTDGVPTRDRDEANSAAVQRDLEHLLARQAAGDTLSASEQRWLENAQSVQKAVDQASSPIWAGLDVDAFIVAYQPHAFGGDGIAAVAYGDPDTADHTAVYVPGIMQDGTLIDENGGQALNLYEETVNQMAAGVPPREGSVSTIAWIGYDSPNFSPESMWPWDVGDSAGDVSHTVTEANAEAGGLALSQFVDGLNSTHTGGDQPHLTVIGHSYGSTTSSYAAAGGMDADSLVLVGSPGAGEGVHHVSDLHMPTGQVFVGAADHDPVTWLGGEDGLLPGTWDDSLGLGADPAQHDFGAITFAVDNGQEFHGTGLVTTGFMENHVNYFDDPSPTHDNAALVNMAAIVSGDTDAVVDTGGRTQEAHDHLYDWAAGEVQHHVVDPVVESYHGVRAGVAEAVDGVVDGARDAWDDVWPDTWP